MGKVNLFRHLGTWPPYPEFPFSLKVGDAAEPPSKSPQEATRLRFNEQRGHFKQEEDAG